MLLEIQSDLGVGHLAQEGPNEAPERRGNQSEPGKCAQGDHGIRGEACLFERKRGEEGHRGGEPHDPDHATKRETNAPPPSDSANDVAHPIANHAPFRIPHLDLPLQPRQPTPAETMAANSPTDSGR